MKLDLIYCAKEAIEGKKGYTNQQITIYPPGQGSLDFAQFGETGKYKKFPASKETFNRGLVNIDTDQNGFLVFSPAGSSRPVSVQDYLKTVSELIVLDVLVMPADFREAGSRESDSWDDQWRQRVNVLNDKLGPTDLTVTLYHDSADDVLMPGIFHGRLVFYSKKDKSSKYDNLKPVFRLIDLSPLQPAQAVAS